MAKANVKAINEAEANKIVVELTKVGVRRKDGWYVGNGRFVYDPTSSGFRAQIKDTTGTTKWGYKSAGFITSVDALKAFISGDNSKLVSAGVRNMVVSPVAVSPKKPKAKSTTVKSEVAPIIWFNKSGKPTARQVETMETYGVQNVPQLLELGVTKKQIGYIIHIADPVWRNKSEENKRYSDYKLGTMGVVLGEPIVEEPKVEPVSAEAEKLAYELIKVANALLKKL